MKSKPSDEFRVIACSKIDSPGPGFALPLATNVAKSNGWFIQQPSEDHGTVERIVEIDATDLTIRSLNSQLVTEAGAKYIFCFIDEFGQPSAGNIDELRPSLEDYYDAFPGDVAVRLQIAELVGGTSKNETAIESFLQFLYSHPAAPNNAASIFIKSFTRARLWDYLIRASKSEVCKRWIVQHRGGIDFSVQSDGIIQLLNLGHEIKERVSMPDILRIEAVLQDVRLANLIKSFLNATSFDRINSESSKFSKQVNKLRLLEKGRKRLQRMKTGLLRVAALINLLMIDDEVGFLLLEEIANRRPTIFEKLAFQELRRASLMFGPNARQIGDEWKRLFDLIVAVARLGEKTEGLSFRLLACFSIRSAL